VQAKNERNAHRRAAIGPQTIHRIVPEENHMLYATDRTDTASAGATAAEQALDANAKMIVLRLIELAEKGDPTALRLCLERIMPPLRERPLQFELPPLATPADAVPAIAAITGGLADGSLSAAEGLQLARMVRVFVEVLVLAGCGAQDAERQAAELPFQEACDGEKQLRQAA
jgi:hypothetical protein